MGAELRSGKNTSLVDYRIAYDDKGQMFVPLTLIDFDAPIRITVTPPLPHLRYSSRNCAYWCEFEAVRQSTAAPLGQGTYFLRYRLTSSQQD